MQERDEERTPEEGHHPTSAEGGTPQEAVQEIVWEVRIAKFGVLFVFIATVSSFVLAIFMSIYLGVVAPPKVWRAPLQPQGGGALMKPRLVRNCVKNLQALDQEQHLQSRALWFQMRHGHRGHLTLWQEWSRSWRKRVHQLRLTCPMAPHQNKAGGTKPMPLAACVGQFKKLTGSLDKKSSALWRKARHGRDSDLRRWRDWSGDWRRRLQFLVERCPLYDKGEIAKAFQRASKTMLKLQTKQEKAMLEFFGSSSDLFRDLRQAMHSLKDEMR